MCTDCSGDTSCTDAYGANHLCQSGTCVTGSCRNKDDCMTGQICNASAQCVGCGTDDAACVAYGNGFICVAGGCVMGTCHDSSTCPGGQICNASHVCAPCPDDASCGTGKICVNNACITGTCHTSNNCSNGQVCNLTTHACEMCTLDTQCTSGQLCLGGACTNGNCRDAMADCTAGQVCLNNSCATCASDGQCASNTTGYGPNHLCQNNVCVPGNCRVKGDCAGSGGICNTSNMLCGACGAGVAGDAQCATEYNGAYICNGGVCVAGNCHSTANCATGQICNLTTHACEGCAAGAAGDAQCADAANYGANHICQNSMCIMGACHVAADCNNSQQICSNFTCGTCSTNTDCTNAYGTNHVCSGGACLSGNCNSSSECGNNQLCVNHSCVACTTDAQCVADTTYGAMHICVGSGNNAQCVAGNCHNTSSDCVGTGQICGISMAHVCGSCGSSDAACKNDPVYGSGDICVAGTCVAGDCHDTSSQCDPGKICGVSTPHTCGNCGAGATGDTQCVNDTFYGTGNICYQGLCGVGNCHATSADCTGGDAGRICSASATNICGACTSDSSCTSDAFYTTNSICNTTTGPSQGKCVTRACSNSNQACAANTGDFCCGGSCTPGNCCVDADCGAIGTACVNHTCSTCNAVSGNVFYVDPVNGNDGTGTGSILAGATPAPGCAFKTITRAIAIIGVSPPVGTKIVLVGAGTTPRGLAAGDALPITIPTNTTLSSTGGPITVTLATTGAGADAGFRLNNNGSGISGGDSSAPLVLDGNNFTAGIAIRVQPGTATFTSSIANVTIKNTLGDGIRVNAGTLTIGAGVVQSASNQDGLRVQGGTVNITNPSGAQTLFTTNVSYGIEVTGNGTLNVTGTPGAPVPSNNGTVVTSFNSQAGLHVAQAVGGTGGTCVINGIVSWGNSNYDMFVQGGSKFKLRNSVLGVAPQGIRITNNGASNDLTQIDLGTAADFGKNWIQMPNGALGFHSGAGICIVMQANLGATLTLNAAGNHMVTALPTSNPGTQVDCSAAAGTVYQGTNCNAGNHFTIGNGTNMTGATPTVIAYTLNMCN